MGALISPLVMLISALAEDEQIVIFKCLDPYRTPPDSGERQYK